MITVKMDLLCKTVSLLYLVNSVIISYAQNQNTFLTKCSDYQDHRFSPTDKNSISIPFSRTMPAAYSNIENVDNSLVFNFTLSGNEAQAILKCLLNQTETKYIPWNFADDEAGDLQPRNFHNVTLGSTNKHQHYYFTNAGYFYDTLSGNYYKAGDDYCVQS